MVKNVLNKSKKFNHRVSKMLFLYKLRNVSISTKPKLMWTYKTAYFGRKKREDKFNKTKLEEIV